LLRLANEGQSKKILTRLEKIIPGAEKLNSQEHALSDFDS
jgi:hypothetical protein